MNINTHLGINESLCGTAVELCEGFSRVSFTATEQMSADDRGLVHGGFLFGSADYAAMLAVNDPTVVLGSAETKFLKPVVVGEVVEARAQVESESGKKRTVSVIMARGEEIVFEGRFVCFVLGKHVLD